MPEDTVAVYRGSTRQDAERAYHLDAQARVEEGYVPAAEEWSTALGHQVLTVRYVHAPDQAPAVLAALAGVVDAERSSPEGASTPVGTTETLREAPIAVAQGASRRLWVTLGVVIFVAVVAAAAFLGLQSGGALTAHHTITGTFDLIDSTTEFPGIDATGGTCEGTGGYSDIAPGASVTLKDGDGKLLGSTSLGAGKGSVTSCTFSFTFKDVPEVPFYTVSVARRGDISNSLAEMKANGWIFGLTLGS